MLSTMKEKIGYRGIRLLSVALAALALWMLWFNWISLGGEIKQDFVDSFRYADNITEMAEDFVDSMEMTGLEVSIAQAKKIVKIVKDGSLSLAEGRTLIGFAAKALGQIKNSFLGSFAGEEMSEMTVAVGFFNVIYQILFLATLLAALWATVQRILARRDPIGTLVFPVLYCVWSLIMLFLWIWGAANLSGDEGIPFVPTFWVLIAPACAIVSSYLWSFECCAEVCANNSSLSFHGFGAESLNDGVSRLKEKGSELVQKGTQALQGIPAKPWTCPVCNTEMKKECRFCTQCGEKRPEAQRCAGCGTLQEPDVAFCANCGQKFVPQKKCEKCNAVVKPEEKFCANCGAPQKEENSTSSQV